MPADLKSGRHLYRLIYAMYGNIRQSVRMSLYRQLNSSLCLVEKNNGKKEQNIKQKTFPWFRGVNSLDEALFRGFIF